MGKRGEASTSKESQTMLNQHLASRYPRRESGRIRNFFGARRPHHQPVTRRPIAHREDRQRWSADAISGRDLKTSVAPAVGSVTLVRRGHGSRSDAHARFAAI